MFTFENDYKDDLHFIPMDIRYKLDVTGLKIGLDAWLKIPLTARKELVRLPLSSPRELKTFEEKIHSSLWSAHEKPPNTLLGACPSALQNTLLSTWPTLSEIQRYALYKLSISKRREETLELAFKEFFPNSSL